MELVQQILARIERRLERLELRQELVLLRVELLTGKVDMQMSKISEYTDKVNLGFGKLETAIDGVAADVTFLKDTITQMQNNPGPISPEDQALLNAAEARLTVLVEKLTALDALTTPPAPPTP